MSNPPDGPWIKGFAPERPEQPADASRKPLYFLVFASAVLAITLMAIFFIKVMETGHDVAEDETTTHSSPSTNGKTETKGESGLDEARTAVKDLVKKPSCTSPDADAKAIVALAKKAEEEDSYDSEKKTLEDSMAKLSEECGAEYTLGLTNAADKGPSKFSKLVKSHSWWHLVSPAPEGTHEATEFTTVVNNIRCRFSEGKVACSIYAYEYPSPDGCEGKTATYTLAQAGDVTADCKSQFNSSVKMDYGTVVSHDGIWCTLHKTEGVTCTSELSGKGFQLKRASDRIF